MTALLAIAAPFLLAWLLCAAVDAAWLAWDVVSGAAPRT